MRVSVSIDLDNYREYQSLVGGSHDGNAASFYLDAVPRFLDLLDRCEVPATFFMIGRDSEQSEHRPIVREIAARGHEVANHSYSHPYNFRALSRAEKEAEIRNGDAAIADILGERPVGFRTPSCDIDSETLELLGELGYLYDSSVFPSPVMWAFMLYGKLFVRHEEYQLGPLSAAYAPPVPYRPRRDHFMRRSRNAAEGTRVVELPISTVLPVARIPFYSTLLRRMGPRAFSWMMRVYGTRRPSLLAIFHLIELADFDGTALAEAFDRMPALAVPVDRRARFVAHAIEEMSRAGEAVTMRELATAYLEGFESSPIP